MPVLLPPVANAAGRPDCGDPKLARMLFHRDLKMQPPRCISLQRQQRWRRSRVRRLKSQVAVFGVPSFTPTPSRSGQESSADSDAHIEQTLTQVMQDQFTTLLDRLDKIEAKVTDLLQQRTRKDWYSIDEVAEILSKAKFTTREWCRLGRINAEKKGSGRGKYQSWVVSDEEVRRIQKEGLLPIRR